jgi:hypothetical protein
MLSYLLLIAFMSLVVTIILIKFPRLSLVRVPVTQRRQEHSQNS